MRPAQASAHPATPAFKAAPLQACCCLYNPLLRRARSLAPVPGAPGAAAPPLAAGPWARGPAPPGPGRRPGRALPAPGAARRVPGGTDGRAGGEARSTSNAEPIASCENTLENLNPNTETSQGGLAAHLDAALARPRLAVGLALHKHCLPRVRGPPRAIPWEVAGVCGGGSVDPGRHGAQLVASWKTLASG